MSSAQPDAIDENIETKIQLLEALRRGQEPLWDDPGRGFTPDFLTSEEFKALQEMSVVQDTPMSYYLDDSQYNLGLLKKALTTIMFEVNEMEIDSDLVPTKLVSDLEGVLPELIQDFIEPDDNPEDTLLVNKSLANDKTRAQIAKLRVETAHKLGLLVERSTVIKVFDTLNSIILNYLHPLGGRVASKIAGLFGSTDQEKINQVKGLIDKEVMRGLDTFKDEAAKAVTKWSKKK